MATILVCDRCGVSKHKNSLDPIRHVQISVDNPQSPAECLVHIDLCSQCYMELQAWLRKKG